ncbi:MAG: hypothetical protein K2M37_00205 [Muribaculaceae bacterium]|nr:hypothetical protein [Muribaculaceae bacterium]
MTRSKRIFRRILPLAAMSSMLLAACGGRDPFVRMARDKDSLPDIENHSLPPSEAASAEEAPARPEARIPQLKETIPAARPARPGRIQINSLGRLADVFNDSNKYQYIFAERVGIRPMASVTDAYFTSKPIVKITSCDLYTVDSLTHSMPYLVPEAAALLADIGRGFRDSLKSRGADGYRIRVTSLLRTPHTVKRLRRINRNATDSSTHQFATTFDISYTRFDCFDSSRVVVQEDLKNLLAEVLWDLRRKERCLVKYERKSPCFHITTTGK